MPALALHPQRTHVRARLIFENSGEIDNRAARVPRVFPTAPRALLIGGEEREVDVLELLGAHALDEADLVAHGLELTERLVIIEQTNIDGGKVALVQQLRQLLCP